MQEKFQGTIEAREDVVAFLIYQVIVDHIDLSTDGSLALVWFSFLDPETGELLPSELGLAIAILDNSTSSGGEWVIYLQSDANWMEILSSVPDEMMDAETKERYYPDEQPQQKGKAFSGYRLPWAAGRKVRVTGSIGHVFTYKTCPTSCLYAFDFSDGTMFPVHAAKAGRVKYAVWQYPDGNTKQANYLVLEDTSTSPTTYQIYFHLAQDSIPAKLRVIGAQVYQGQFIGNADDTGASSGHHLHFHVHTNSAIFWGNSVDIKFDDVDVNGGRPRTCAEARMFPDYGDECHKGDWYTSSNGDYNPPKGGIDEPKKDTVISKPVITIKGWGKDDTGISSMQLYWFKEDTWYPLGPSITKNSFSQEVDLCAYDVPLGPFLIGLQVIDQAGKVTKNLQGMRPLQMDYDCNPPPPECFPTSTQIAVYENEQFTGYCEVLDKGEYPSLDFLEHVKNDNIASIKLGKDVMALTYTETDFFGEREIFTEGDLDLTDNPIGLDAISSVVVRDLISSPVSPMQDVPKNQKGFPVTVADEVNLTWEKVADAEEYQSELTGPRSFQLASEWQTGTKWQIGRLAQGEYLWTVKARNILGEAQASLSFTVLPADVASSVAMEPLPATQGTTAIKLTWKVISGKDDLERFEVQYRQDGGEWEDWETSLSSESRQAIFMGKPGSHYDFRMRSIDLAGNIEPYPQKPEASVEISTCMGDDYEEGVRLDDEISGASPIDIGENQQHDLCAPGDVDWVIFPAQAGQELRLSTNGSKDANVATFIQLYESDGTTLLGEAYPGDERNTTEIAWIAPLDGFYYLRVQADDPALAGEDVTYTLRIDSVGDVNPIPIACSSLLLPALWLVIKRLLKSRTKISKHIDPELFE
ncbi:MAG: peptidoglycan DD-metalloendopeptidase family protein [Anaerolineae bacterium]|nr:peptidoglycan DD-metalloendopeptidase family protein [Anaerolineae bacterium]